MKTTRPARFVCLMALSAAPAFLFAGTINDPAGLPADRLIGTRYEPHLPATK